MDSSFRRIAVIAALIFAGALPFTFVAEARQNDRKAPLPRRTQTLATLVVPNVKGQAYVVAQEILEDAGLAWHVTGKNGFPANRVVAQSPKAGTRIVDTGAPLVTLKVKRNRAYPQRGIPDNKSPYRGTGVRLVKPS